MPRTISQEEIAEILQTGDFNRFLGRLEDEHLECKSFPYRLDDERQKMELAKDVSALANTDGGTIIIGLRTEQEPTSHGDVIRGVSCFPHNLIDLNQHKNIISDWVIPSISGLEVDWHPSATNPNEGLASIIVPHDVSRDRPFLVVKVLDETEHVVGAYVAFFERANDDVLHMKAAELRERLKDGLRFRELDTRLESIEDLVARVGGRVTPPEPPFSFDEDIFRQRVQLARRVAGLDDKPAYSHAAWPLEPVDFPHLFESHDTPTVKLLENPPVLRSGGFDFGVGRRSEIIEAQRRRCLIPDHRLLEVWRDGPLISVLPGNADYLCWAMHSSSSSGWRINNLALAETVYLFCDWAVKVYQNAVPIPAEFKIRVMLSGMSMDGKKFLLSPYRPADPGFDGSERESPNANGQHFEVQVDPQNRVPGVIAYLILADVYNWFGFDAAEMPYVNRSAQPREIDPAQLH